MAGEGNQVHANRWVIAARPHNSTAAYGTADLVGTKMTFEDVIPEDYGGGSIRSVQVLDYSDQMAAVDLILFGDELASNTGAGTTWATGDNAALDIADSDALNIIGAVSIGTGDYHTFSDNAVAVKQVDIPFYIRGRNLYGLLVSRGAPTYGGSTDEIVVSIGVERDAN